MTVTAQILTMHELPELGGRGRLGARIQHDSRSWAYRVRRTTDRVGSVNHTRAIPVLDQGDIGRCVGNAGTGLLGTAPILQPLLDAQLVGIPELTEDYADALYAQCTREDDAPGTYLGNGRGQDTGTDGLTLMKVLVERGLLSGYQHAMSVGDAQAAIQAVPLALGIPWYSSFDEPRTSDGLVSIAPRAYVRGYHEIECCAYDATLDLWSCPNSWGTSWGDDGWFRFTSGTFAHLFAGHADVQVPVPLSEPTPTPTPTPGDKVLAAAQTLYGAMPAGWVDGKHRRDNATAAVAVRAFELDVFGRTR